VGVQHDEVVAFQKADSPRPGRGRRARDGKGNRRFDVEDTNASGHSWGYVMCLVCSQKFAVWSTPKSADNHANQISRFLRHYDHQEAD
jgi:hypothetical protein